MNNPILNQALGKIHDQQLNDFLAECVREREEAVRYVEENTKTCEECGMNFVDGSFDVICQRCMNKEFGKPRFPAGSLPPGKTFAPMGQPHFQRGLFK